MAAITQISHQHSNGRAYYQRKIAEGKTHKEALRCLKRRISNAIYARRADARKGGPGPKTTLRAGRTRTGHAAARASAHKAQRAT